MTISITEHLAIERAMTGERWCIQGPWPQATVYVDDAAIHDDSLQPTHVATMTTLLRHEQNVSDDHDAAVIVAMRNAYPALLAIAAAALDFMAANDRTDIHGDAYLLQRADACEALREALKAVTR